MSDILSNAELATRYMAKEHLLGSKQMIMKILPKDKVMLIEVLNKRSTGKFIIPNFITEFAQIRTTMSYRLLFDGCRFTEVYIDNPPNIDLDISYLFSRMESSTLKIRFKHPECIVRADRLFDSCIHLKELDFSGLDTSRIMSMSYMFHNCMSLRSIDLSIFNTVKVKNMAGMFRNCQALEEVNLSSFNFSGVMDLSYMFYSTPKLNRINTSDIKLNSDAIIKGILGLSNLANDSVEVKKWMTQKS